MSDRDYHQSENEPSSDLETVQNQLTSLAHEVRGELDPNILFEEGAKLGDYTIGHLIDFGGQAYVFKAYDDRLQRDVVIKLYRVALSASEKERAIEEARCLIRVDSPYIARCLDYQVQNNRPYLVLEYVDGQTLTQYAESTRLSSERILSILKKIMIGVDTIHQCGVLHLDLKPDNVIVRHDGEIKIVDFGLSRREIVGAEQRINGSPAFLPPEIACGRNEEIGPQTDVFGIGGILYYLQTSQPVFSGDSKSNVLSNSRNCEIAPVKDLDPSVSNSLSNFVDRCLSPSVEARFASVKDAMNVLDSISARKKLAKWALKSAAGVLLASFVLFAINVANSFNAKPKIESGLSIAKATQSVAIGEANSISVLENLKEDFQFELTRIEQCFTPGKWSLVNKSNGVYRLTEGFDVRFSFKSELPVYLDGYCLQSETSGKITSNTPIYDSLADIPSQSTEFIEVFEPEFAGKEVNEFLYLVASTSVPSRISQQAANQAIAKRTDWKSRGLNRKGGQRFSELVIPFKVIKKTTN